MKLPEAPARRRVGQRRRRSSTACRGRATAKGPSSQDVHPRLHASTRRSGGTPRQITGGKYNHSDPEWSADGKTIYVSGIRKPDAEYLRSDSEIYAVDLTSLAVTPLTDRKGPDANPAVSPDGRWIAYTGYDDKNGTRATSRAST